MEQHTVKSVISILWNGLRSFHSAPCGVVEATSPCTRVSCHMPDGIKSGSHKFTVASHSPRKSFLVKSGDGKRHVIRREPKTLILDKDRIARNVMKASRIISYSSRVNKKAEDVIILVSYAGGEASVIWDKSLEHNGWIPGVSEAAVFNRDRDQCQYCGKYLGHLPKLKTIDHYHPKCQGGPWEWDNLVTCCLYCNNRKGRTLPDLLDTLDPPMKLLKPAGLPGPYHFIYYKDMCEEWLPFCPGWN